MGETPSLRQLECFVALAACRSFRRAAESLGVSQPALSTQIRALETALDVVLVERRAHGAELTPIGREALPYAEAALAAARAMTTFAASARQRLNGRFRLGASSTVGPYLLPQMVGQLHRAHPALRLVVRESAPETLAGELVRGAHDAVLMQLPLRTDGVHVEELFRERLLVMLAADDPLASAPSVPAEALAGRSVLTLDARFELHRQVAEIATVFGAHLAEDYVGGSLDALRLMVGMGAGVAFAPELYVRAAVRAGDDVVARPLRGRAIQRVIGLAWRRSCVDQGAMAELASVARHAFAALTAAPIDP